MQLSRRLACRWSGSVLATAFLFLFATGAASAQGYPKRAIRMVVPYAPGQGADTFARALCDRLAQVLGQPIVIDNKPGAGGNIGAELVAQAAPDGYTLLWGSNATNAANQALYKNMSFNPQRDLVPISLMSQAQMVISVLSSDRHDSIKSLLADARANPGKISVAIPSTTSRVVVAEMQRLSGIELFPVAYKSSAGAMADLMGGHVPLTVDTLGATLPLVRSGKIRPLAVTLAYRSDVLPDVPTVAEAGVPGLNLGPWTVIAAPRGTPSAIIDLLNARIAEIVKEPETRKKMRDVNGTDPGVEPTFTPAQVQSFVTRETKTWGRIIREANISID